MAKEKERMTGYSEKCILTDQKITAGNMGFAAMLADE
jgi:hypothetical protein